MSVISRTFSILIILATIATMLAGADNSNNERDSKIDAALYYYYSGKTEAAKAIAKELKNIFPEDPFFYELMAEITWQELEKKAAGQQKEKKIDYQIVKRNQYLVEQFYNNVYEGLVLTQKTLEQNPQSAKDTFLRGMLLIRLGGFIAKFEEGLRSYAEADSKTADGIETLKKSFALDQSLCSAKYLMALAKHMLILAANNNWLNRLPIVFQSRVYTVLGRNLDQNDVFSWLHSSINCQSEYYYTKDIEIDKKMIYQNILIKYAGRFDEEIIPILQELNAKFPENTVIKNNLFLVNMHRKNKQKNSP